MNKIHKVTIRLTDREKEFLDNRQESQSEIIRKALRMYMTRYYKFESFKKGTK